MSLVGHELSHFQILEKLGEGGMGVVYKARDTRLDRDVALKVLPPDKVADPERQRRFVQEAKAASALSHPGIVTIYDIDNADGMYFIAMEYVAGKTLDRLIGRKGLALDITLGYGVQIADALARAHGAGIVHRDLKPANIIVADDGLVKILDFGLAKLIEPAVAGDSQTVTVGHSELPVTEEGKIVGTVAYMSPEQAQGKPVDARSDIFSFGSVLFEMLTGRRPFTGETAVATMAAILNQEPAPLSDTAGPWPQEVERVVTRCLRKDPQRRWQNMADLKVALQDLKEESATGKLSAATFILPQRSRRKWPFAAAAALALAIAAAAAGWWFSRKPAGPPVFETERLTFESGFVGIPAISPDGKLLAYSSDRDGAFHLYVQQIGGQEAVQLTHQEAADWSPDFSPDGSKIVFRSERDGGGIYVMGALGGPQQKIADRGWFPRYSSDGSTIAYIVTPALTYRGRLYLVPARGGTPKPFQPASYVASLGPWYSPPIWSPDGQSILFDGGRDGDPKSRDWWIAPVSSGDPARAMAPAWSPQASLRYTFGWRGKYVYYSEGGAGVGMGIYRVPVAGPPWKVAGVPERITPPMGMQLGGAISADGRLVFSSCTQAMNLWSFPLKGNEGATFGERRQLTTDFNTKIDLAGAASGSTLAYVASTGKKRGSQIRLREVSTGREEVIASSGSMFSLLPRLSADGSHLAWRDVAEGKLVSFLSEPGSGSSTRLCESCSVLDFFPGGREALVLRGKELARLDAATGARTALLDLTGLPFSDAALSPDARWLAVTVTRADGMAALLVVPVGQQPVPRDSWIQIAEDRNYLSRPGWSPDGRWIYYGSTRDNFWCIWAQRIGAGGKPDGAPRAALHMHRFSETNFFGWIYFSVAPGNLYMLLVEGKGNVWMAKIDR